MSFRSFLFFLVLSVLILPFLFLGFWPGKELELIACNVGQGDAILITKGFTQVLIDGGPNNLVLDCLNENIPFWDRTIELVVNTHPDKDHVGGLVEVVRRYEVKQILSNSLWLETEVFKEFNRQVREKKIPVYSPQAGEKIRVAGIEFKVLWPKKKIENIGMWQGLTERVLGESSEDQKTNESSIVLHLKEGDFDAILTGDITEKEEKEIVEDYDFSEIEVLKVAHHGSKYSSCLEFLEAVRPEIAIISVGKNPWGHPTKEVLERLDSVGAKVLRTDQGEVRLKI